MIGELRHALAAIEVLDRRDNGFALGLGLGESHGICKIAIWNIYSRFHASSLSGRVFLIKRVIWNIMGERWRRSPGGWQKAA